MRVVSNVISNYLTQFLIALLSFAFIPFYLEQLGPGAYGLVGIFAVAQSLFSVVDAGLGHLVTREILSPGRRADAILLGKRSINIFLLVSVILGAGFFLLSDVIRLNLSSPSFFLDPHFLRFVLLIAGLSLGLKSVDSVYKSIFYGLNWQSKYNLIASLSAILKVCGLLVLLPVFKELGLLIFFGWQLACIGFAIVLMYVQLSAYVNSRADSLLASSSLMSSRNAKFIGHISGLSLVYLVYMQLDKLIVARYSSLSEFGYYTFSGTAAAAVAYLSLPVVQALYPSFCAFVGSQDFRGLALSFRKSNQLINIVVLSAVALGVIYSRELLLFWSQSQDLANAVSPVFSLLLIANACVALAGLPNNLLMAMGQVKILQFQMLLLFGLYFLLLLGLVPVYGPYGAGFAWIVASGLNLLIILPFNLARCFKHLGGKTYFLADLFAAGASSFAVAISFKLLWRSFPQVPAYALLPLVFLLSLLSAFSVSKSVRGLVLDRACGAFQKK